MHTSAEVFVDLHVHTSCSDGVFEPLRMFDEIRRAKLALFSITDHDTMAAYPIPDDLQDRALRGIEVDSELHGRTVHLLAYGVGSESPLLQTLGRQRADRYTRMQYIVSKLQRQGYPIELSDVLAEAGSAASLGRPHLARALVARGIVATVQEAFDRFLADDGPAFVALQRLSAKRIVDLIHESGGVAVVAHPKRLRASDDLCELVALGVDGVEVHHPTADAHDRVVLQEFADSRDLLSTGGTDFHAPPSGERVKLGVSIDRRAAEQLVQRVVARG